jgi:PTH1 family peptidyl-tRNA hydrolase
MVVCAFLGNPGKKYSNHRHNIGFILGDEFCRHFHVQPVMKKFESRLVSVSVNGTETILLFPQTYMNESGRACQAALSFYKTGSEKLLVVHDEIELSFGEYQFKFGGGHKGQNGIRSIIQQLGSPDFHRFRFGVGRPPDERASIADYVLSPFSKEERVRIDEMKPNIIQKIAEKISLIEMD